MLISLALALLTAGAVMITRRGTSRDRVAHRIRQLAGYVVLLCGVLIVIVEIS
ncbi:hypothetical protein [Croceicoccus bisphenolivorans]|uniref:hypothetical protein n=1 Tax=Croceicoccus bisphenolivorans TaxID=1783232 RepID=UPI000ACDDA5C|nr:hypothetical protein [Croceicoccus bisphenolivorans]